MMKKIVLIVLIISLSCVWSTTNKRLLGKTVAIKQDPYSSEEIYKIKELYDAGNHSALDALIKIYQDKDQTYSIRILCLDMLAEIEKDGTNPLIKDAIKNTLENSDFIEMEYLKKSILILQNYKAKIYTTFVNSSNIIYQQSSIVVPLEMLVKD